jgi:hypothetical protein
LQMGQGYGEISSSNATPSRSGSGNSKQSQYPQWKKFRPSSTFSGAPHRLQFMIYSTTTLFYSPVHGPGSRRENARSQVTCPQVFMLSSLGDFESFDEITVLMPGRKVVQLPFKSIPTLLIKCGSLEAVTSDQDHSTPPTPGFLFGGFQ